jgi:hypothetical protein
VSWPRFVAGLAARPVTQCPGEGIPRVVRVLDVNGAMTLSTQTDSPIQLSGERSREVAYGRSAAFSGRLAAMASRFAVNP